MITISHRGDLSARSASVSSVPLHPPGTRPEAVLDRMASYGYRGKKREIFGNQIESLVIAYREKSNTRCSSRPTTRRAVYSQSASGLGSCNEGALPPRMGLVILNYC